MITIEILTYEENRLIKRSWRLPTRYYHRVKGVAYTSWYFNGQKAYEEYWVNGQLHRDPSEGPAYTRRGPEGRKDFEEYWVSGQRHRSRSRTSCYILDKRGKERPMRSFG